MQSHTDWNYDRSEIFADGVIHVLGLSLAFAGAMVLVAAAARGGSVAQLVAILVYLAGLLAVLGLSAAYNLWPVSPFKWWLRRFDHAAIYLLIAATYTAFVLPMHGARPGIMLALLWLVAFAGMTLKILWPRRFDRTSIALYLLMGWSGLPVLGPLTAVLTPVTLVLIMLGGTVYSVGVIFHIWSSLRFQNAIWHAFVLVAALCHYAAVLNSVSA